MATGAIDCRKCCWKLRTGRYRKKEIQHQRPNKCPLTQANRPEKESNHAASVQSSIALTHMSGLITEKEAMGVEGLKRLQQVSGYYSITQRANALLTLIQQQRIHSTQRSSHDAGAQCFIQMSLSHLPMTNEILPASQISPQANRPPTHRYAIRPIIFACYVR